MKSAQILLGLSCLCMVVNSVAIFSHEPSSRTLLEAVEPLVLFSLLLLTVKNHHRSRRSSTIVLLFWPIYVVESLIWVHVHIPSDLSRLRPNFYLRCTTLVLGVLSWALECLGTERTEKGENPILTANVYSKWFYIYLTPLMEKGSKEYLTEEDLPPLTQEDKAGRLGGDLKRAKAKQCVILYMLYRPFLKMAPIVSRCGWHYVLHTVVHMF